MSEIKKDCLYTKDHEWVKKSDPGVVTMGISDFAQSALGDVTFLQLPPVGQQLKAGEIVGTVESVKAVSDIYAPVSGKVIEVNTPLVQDPSPLNSDPFGKAWLLKIQLSAENELNSLLSPEAYAQVAQ